VNGRPGYRCRHGHSSAKTTSASQPPNLYLREDHTAERIRTAMIIHGIETTVEDPQSLAALAHSRKITFVCGPNKIEANIGEGECQSGSHQGMRTAHGG